jgi:copper transport protein
VRRLAVVGALAPLLLALPADALAHASIRGTSPSFRQRLEVAPALVRVRFDQKVQMLPGSIRVYNARGRQFGRRPRADNGGRGIAVAVRTLPTGAYTVRWRAISRSDGHVVSGVFTFGVRADAPEPTEAYGASGPTTTEHVVRWLYFVALSLLVGGLGFRLLVLRGPVPAAFERRFYIVTGIGVVSILELGIVAFLLRAQGALQLPFVDFLYGDLSPIAGGTRFGTAFVAMTLGFALTAALLFLAWLTGRHALLWAAFLFGLGFASGLSLSGHAADNGALTELADWLHLTAGTLWAGGLLMLVAVVWPTAPELRRRAFLGFARLAPVLIAALVAAGVYLSVMRLPALDDLWGEGYGRVLLVKLGLVSLALAWGGVHHFFVRPRLERAGSGRVRRSLLGEAAVGMAVLLAAAVLVDSEPPKAQPAPTQAAPLRR